MAKIPGDLRLILSRQFSGENWNLDELLKALKTELEARERCASSSVGISSRSTQVNPPLPRWKGEEAEGNPTAATTRLRNALQLPTIKQDTLMIETFGSDTGQLQSRDLVQLCVQGLTSETCLRVNAYAVPIICSPLQNQAVNFAASSYPHLHGLPLADSISADENGDHVEVDVLIGADYYWHFLTGALKRG